MNAKQRAAEAALKFVQNDSVIGLGSGSTADFFLMALGEALRGGKLRNVMGVATSEQTARRAAHLGIPLTELAVAAPLAMTIDGADEISPTLDLIKGLGGALLREKIVAQNSNSLIIIADVSKRVSRLGTRAALPVEVAPFAHEAISKFLQSLGCQATLRIKDGKRFTTDNGNFIYDCRFSNGIENPAALDEQLAHRAGIIETGLFLRLTDMAIVADDSMVQTLKRD